MLKAKRVKGVVVKLKEIDELTFCSIKRKFYEIFLQKQIVPTIMDLHEEVLKDETLPNYSFKTFVKIVKHLSLKYASREMKIEIVQSLRAGLWTIYYLQRVMKYRKSGKYFYYVDEVVLNEGTNKNSKDDVSTSNKGKKLIACHIGSEEGFLDNDLLVTEVKKDLTQDTFEDWFKKILPKLKENSVVILDHADCHSRRVIKTPDNWSSKSEMSAWLDFYNISHDKNLYKPFLYVKVENERHKYVKFVLDVLATERGITVLRVPPYCNRLNPMQTIMYELRNSFKGLSINNMEELKTLINEKQNEISLERWQELIDIAVKEEEWLFNVLHTMDEVTDENIECMSSGDEYEEDEFDKDYQDFVDVLTEANSK